MYKIFFEWIEEDRQHSQTISSEDNTKEKGKILIGRDENQCDVVPRWLLVESGQRRKLDLNKLAKQIKEEFLNFSKKLANLGEKKFEDKYEAEFQIKELAAKLKYHQISDLEITEIVNKEGK